MNKELKLKYHAKCTNCGKVFNEGYCINGGDKYFCSDDCLHTLFTPKEWKEHYNDGGDSYWTEWECEEDMYYYEDGTEI